MIRLAVLGGIGSGKSYLARSFGYPVFNADDEVGKIYRKNKNIFQKLKKKLPKFIKNFPIQKEELMLAIHQNENNIKKIISIVHPEVRKQMNLFLSKNKNKKLVVLDIPLFLENKLNLPTDILVFVDSNEKQSLKKIQKRKGFNKKIFNYLKKIQLPVDIKKSMADFVVKNNFNSAKIKKEAKNLIEKIIV